MGENSTRSPSLFITSQKLQEQRGALGKMTFENEKHRAIWQDVLKLELISSEESGYDDGDEVIYVKPLPWRSKQFSEFVARLDIQAVSNKSAMAKRQSKRRLENLLHVFVQLLMSQIGFLLTSDIPQLADIYISLQTFDWNYDLETSIDDGLHSSLTASCKSLNQIFFC